MRNPIQEAKPWLQNGKMPKSFLKNPNFTDSGLNYLDSVEAGFGGTMLIKLKNGCKDYVSRFYLKDLKKYLGL